MEYKSKQKTSKITIDELRENARNGYYKVHEVDYNAMIDKLKMHSNTTKYSSIKKQADRYNIPELFGLFNQLCAQHKEIIDIHTYMDAYLEIVEEELDWKDRGHAEYEAKKREVFLNIFSLRAYGSYVSNIAEISYVLHLRSMLDEDRYEIVFNDKVDHILGVDIVVLDRYKDKARYIKVTKSSPFAEKKLIEKSTKTVRVKDTLTNFFVVFERRHIDAIISLYNKDNEKTTENINDVLLFQEGYVKRQMSRERKNIDRDYYDSIEYLKVNDED